MAKNKKNKNEKKDEVVENKGGQKGKKKGAGNKAAEDDSDDDNNAKSKLKGAHTIVVRHILVSSERDRNEIHELSLIMVSAKNSPKRNRLSRGSRPATHLTALRSIFPKTRPRRVRGLEYNRRL